MAPTCCSRTTASSVPPRMTQCPSKWGSASLPRWAAAFVAELRARIASSRLSAARAVNRELVGLYWDIGAAILKKQATHGWGQAVVAKERGPDDEPSIGIILCAEKDNLEVEFSLKTKANPIGVAEYHLQLSLPPALKGKLPTRKQLNDVVRSFLPSADSD